METYNLLPRTLENPAALTELNENELQLTLRKATGANFRAITDAEQRWGGLNYLQLANHPRTLAIKNRQTLIGYVIIDVVDKIKITTLQAMISECPIIDMIVREVTNYIINGLLELNKTEAEIWMPNNRAVTINSLDKYEWKMTKFSNKQSKLVYKLRSNKR